MIIGVDFDGTCVTHEFPRIGKDIGAEDILRELIHAGHKIILFTMRSDKKKPSANGEYGITEDGGDYLTQAVNWFKEKDIPLYGVNENPSQKSWTDSPKPYCHLYIDDAALGVPLESNPHVSSRPYVDWVRVMDELVSNGYLDLDNLIPIEEEEEEIC